MVIIRNKFFDPEAEALITIIGDYVIVGSPIEGESYIDFQTVNDPHGDQPYCYPMAMGAMDIDTAKKIVKELEEAIQYLEGSE